MKFILIILLFYSVRSYSKDTLPSIKELCSDVEIEIKDLELMKKNLKKEFKYKDTTIEQFELLPELTKDINNIIQQQISQAKLYHYLDCSDIHKQKTKNEQYLFFKIIS